MGFLSVAAHANYSRYFRKLKALAKREGLFYPRLLWDTGWCVLRYGMALTDYLNFKLYKRNHAQRLEYFGAMREEKFYNTVSPAAYKKRFTIKPDFIREFADFTRREITVPGKDDFAHFCAFLDKHPAFMSKPYDGSGGASVEKKEAAQITDRQAFYDYAATNRIYLEQLVTQHPDMNVLCPASVNTIRFMTYNDKGTPILLWAGLRVGNGINPVDNFHAQGMGVKIDPETGRLVGVGINKDNEEFIAHPTTGVVFEGFQIPCFREAVDMVLEAALKSDKILMIGWDIAISDKGPLIIEANRWPGFDLVQVLDDRGRMDIVRDVLRRFNSK